jgi:cytochrome c556
MMKILLAVSALALTVSTSFADPLADRKALMKSLGGGLGAMAPIARGEQPYDADKVATALASLSETAGKLDVAALFPAGSGTGDTDALPAIWDNVADFTARMDKLKADIAEVAASVPADQAGVGAALGKLGANCGSCHEVYRAKKG